MNHDEVLPYLDSAYCTVTLDAEDRYAKAYMMLAYSRAEAMKIIPEVIYSHENAVPIVEDVKDKIEAAVENEEWLTDAGYFIYEVY